MVEAAILDEETSTKFDRQPYGVIAGALITLALQLARWLSAYICVQVLRQLSDDF